MIRRALLLLAPFVASACSPHRDSGDNQPKSRVAAREGMVCVGTEATKTDVDQSGEPKAATHYLAYGPNGDLLVWDQELGDLRPFCRGWGEACGSQTFPLKVEVRGARSEDERIDVDLYRSKGLLIETEKHPASFRVFTGTCHKGHVPATDVTKRAV